MIKFTKYVEQTFEVVFFEASMAVRYWEDATVNGIDETENDPKMPLREDDLWKITVELETGRIVNWPGDTTATTHYKVCDAGLYRILDANNEIIAERDRYVPSMLAPDGNGFGDYVILEIDEDGMIKNWQVDLSYFEDND